MKSLKILLPALLLVVLGTSAKAQDRLGLAYLYGYGGHTNIGVAGYNHNVPYFALHPPVYYGQRYSRPYGVSPFATWPQLQSAPGYMPGPRPHHSMQPPVVIVNPYAPTSAAPDQSGTGMVEVAPTLPTVIENPYFKSEVRYTAR